MQRHILGICVAFVTALVVTLPTPPSAAEPVTGRPGAIELRLGPAQRGTHGANRSTTFPIIVRNVGTDLARGVTVVLTVHASSNREATEFVVGELASLEEATAGRPVTIEYATDEEPPTLEWSVRYQTSSGSIVSGALRPKSTSAQPSAE